MYFAKPKVIYLTVFICCIFVENPIEPLTWQPWPSPALEPGLGVPRDSGVGCVGSRGWVGRAGSGRGGRGVGPPSPISSWSVPGSGFLSALVWVGGLLPCGLCIRKHCVYGISVLPHPTGSLPPSLAPLPLIDLEAHMRLVLCPGVAVPSSHVRMPRKHSGPKHRDQRHHPLMWLCRVATDQGTG